MATTSEPWLLLPFAANLCEIPSYSAYGTKLANIGMREFMSSLPSGADTYRAELARFIANLYDQASPDGAEVFVDKTPRYTLIASELKKLFPDARFIVLWRNPLAIVASMIESFYGGAWRLYANYVDLYDGLESLYRFWEQSPDELLTVRYEDFVSNPEDILRKLSHFLGLDGLTLPNDLSSLVLAGSLGDQTGITRFTKVTDTDPDRWKVTYRNPYRKRWIRKYVQWIGDTRLSSMGYDYHELLSSIDGIAVSSDKMLSDVSRLIYGELRRRFCIDIVRDRFGAVDNGKRVGLIY